MEKDYIEKIEAVEDLLKVREVIKDLISEAKHDLRYHEDRIETDDTSYHSDNAMKYRILCYCLSNMLDKMCFEFFEGGAIPPKFDGSEYEPKEEEDA